MTEDTPPGKSIILGTGETEDGDPFATILWKIKDIEDIELISTHEFIVQRMPWFLSVSKKMKNEDKSEYLSMVVYGQQNCSTMWSVDVNTISTLINRDKSKNCNNEWTKTFNHSTDFWGIFDFIKWDTLVDYNEGFINDGAITVEVRITIRNVKGISTLSRVQFTNPNEPRHDITLIIEGKKLYVGKQYLSHYSPVFSSMFYGDFDDKNQKEIELKDVIYEDFVQVLNMIFPPPSDKNITDDNAERLLALCDRFQIKTIIDQVEKFLIDSTKLSLVAKLKLSGQYRLVFLQRTEEYKEFSNETKNSLLEKILKMLPD